jgi:hypothetical protein
MALLRFSFCGGSDRGAIGKNRDQWEGDCLLSVTGDICEPEKVELTLKKAALSHADSPIIDEKRRISIVRRTAPDFVPTACLRHLPWVTGRFERRQPKLLTRKVEVLLSKVRRELLKQYWQMVYLNAWTMDIVVGWGF